MAITVLPPVPITKAEQSDLMFLEAIVTMFAGVLDHVATIPSADRTVSIDAIESLNNTLIDASDRIDTIINPPTPVVLP